MRDDGGAAERALVEERFRAALDAGDHDAAVTAIVRGYGPELLRFLAALHRDEDATADVFSIFTETLWKVTPTYEGRCSARTWAYAIARRVSSTYQRDARRRAARFRPFPDDSAIPEAEAHVRTETLSFLRTERREKLAVLRESLPPDDQMLLMLRIHRQLSWLDLALVLREGEAAPLSPEARKREAARLRKRFQLLKDKLRQAAAEEGLLEDRPDEP